MVNGSLPSIPLLGQVILYTITGKLDVLRTGEEMVVLENGDQVTKKTHIQTSKLVALLGGRQSTEGQY